MRFKLSDNVPSNGTITIYFPIPLEITPGSITEYCWLNLKYSSCSRDNESIVLTLGEEYVALEDIELKLDAGVSNPTGVLDENFTIESIFKSTVLSETTYSQTVASLKYFEEDKV